MFPVEIISRIVEIVLGDVGKNALARGRDSKRRFARDLFAFYDAAKEYKGWCQFLLDMLEREKRLEPNRRMSWSTAYEAQKVSDDMADLIRVMVGKFRDELRAKFTPLDRPSRKAAKRFKVLQIYDAQLAALLERAMTIDLNIAYIAAAMSQQKFDDESQNIIFLDPDSADIFEAIKCVDHRDRDVGRASFVSGHYDLEKRDVVNFFRTAKFTSDSDFSIFAELLRRNISAIDDLTESIAAFIKANFSIEELL